MYELQVEELIDRLNHGGIEAWNAYRQNELADEDLHLTYSSFGSRELPTDWTGIDLSRAVIEGGVIDGDVVLANANLRWSEFSEFSIGQENDFSGADLRNADFAGAQLHKCCFASADLRDANFSFALLARGVPTVDPETDKIVDALRSADFTGAQIEGLNVFSCKIQTALGYFPESVASPEDFFAYAREAEMKTEGAVGTPRVGIDWEGRFKTYRPR